MHDQNELKANRRDFLKKSALAGVATALVPVMSLAEKTQKFATASRDGNNESGKQTVTFLITTDIHSQLNTLMNFFGRMEKQFIVNAEDLRF